MASKESSFSNRTNQELVAGQAALEGGRFEEAANHLRAALRISPASVEEEALIRCYLSEALQRRSLNRETLEAVAKYDNSPEFARLSERTQMFVLRQLGWAYSYNRNIPRAIALFNQALHIARQLNDEMGSGICHFGLGRAYRFVSESRIARDHYTSALEHFRRVGNWRHLADCYINIGNIDAREGDYRTALSSINQALTIIGNRDEHDLLGRAYLDLGIVYDRLDAPVSKVLALHEKALEHHRRSGNIFWQAIISNNLAQKLSWIGEWDRAELVAKSAIETLRTIPGLVHLAAALDTLAHVYLLKGKLDEADRLLEEALQVFSSNWDKQGSLNNEHPSEIEIRATIGISYLKKSRPDLAIKHCECAVDIAERTGYLGGLFYPRLWLAEALIQSGRLEEARAQVKSIKALLQETPDMPAWGLMMRVVAKLEAADGHLASAIQSLGQSTSVFEVKGNIYDLAVNRMILAGILERQGRISNAIAEAGSALAVFARLGASLDWQNAKAHLESLNHGLKLSQSADKRSEAAGAGRLDLVSIIDGFMAHRFLQASFSRGLLLYELVSILREHSNSRAVLLAEIENEERSNIEGAALRIAASVGMSESELKEQIGFLSKLPPQNHQKHYVYQFGDNQQASFLLRLIEPKASRFKDGTVNLRPLLEVVERGLEIEVLKNKSRRAKVFDSAPMLAELGMPGFICVSRAMTRVLEQINKIRSSDVTVLITGESGTGKELIARAVHTESSRRNNRFLPFNCSASPRDMIESQLFGYRKGAFTGAISNYEGIIRAAERGTLFLDEIGDLPLDLQPKLLRFLQEGEVHPIGESQPLAVDVRVIAATNSNLEKAVAEGKFREDLYHRLNVIRIQVPPLRERREEIPVLLNHYLNIYQQEMTKREIKLSEKALDLMVVYDWPGNVRQLCNEVRRIVAYSESDAIVTEETLSPEIVLASGKMVDTPGDEARVAEPPQANLARTLAEAVDELERQMIQDALRRSSGNIARAARDLGLTRRGLYMKMDRHHFKA